MTNWKRGLNRNGHTHFSKYINNAYVIWFRCIFYKLFYTRKCVCCTRIFWKTFGKFYSTSFAYMRIRTRVCRCFRHIFFASRFSIRSVKSSG